MTERVTFPSLADETASGWIALPAGAGKAPAVVLVQEWWGVNDQIKGIAEKWAGEGFIALAVDLYRGAIAKDAAEAGQMMKDLDRTRAMADLGGALAYLRAHPRASGKLGVTGYCMGGAFTLAAAAAFPDLAAAVPFYGIPPAADWSKVTAPVLFHVATRDTWVTPAAAEAVRAAIAAAGAPIEVALYDADHAFCNERRPEVYDASACAEAWSRTVAFMKQHAA
jgi:carboxymethylenebutenolidase